MRIIRQAIFVNEELKNLIEGLEVELMQPEIRKSRERIHQLLADDFVEFGSSGKVHTKEDELEYLPNNTDVEYSLSDFKGKMISEDTVLATYVARKKEVKTGAIQFSLRSSIWQKRNGSWQLTFHQATPTGTKS